MSTFKELYEYIQYTMPPWTHFESESYLRKHLGSLKLSELKLAQTKNKTKESLINEIVGLWSSLRGTPVPGPDSYKAVCHQYQTFFGTDIFRCLIKSIPRENTVDRESHAFLLPTFVLFAKEAISRCPLDDVQQLRAVLCIKEVLKPDSVSFHAKCEDQAMKSIDIFSIISKIFQINFLSLYSLSDSDLIHTYLSEHYGTFDPNADLDLCTMILAILQRRGYPLSVLDSFLSVLPQLIKSTDLQLPIPGTHRHRKHLERKNARIKRVADEIHASVSENEMWPQPVTESTIKSCFASYRKSIQYVPLSVCASCGAEDRLRTGSYVPIGDLPSMDILRVNNDYILAHTPPSRFKYIHRSLDGLLLDPKGIRATDQACLQIELFLCAQCNGSLFKTKMPRFALNNNLYRGELPSYLQDITWVEEMACALYRTTAHVARIYGSTSDTDPLQLRGNTCAHPLNLLRNAKSLPWAPSDLNDLITIIFVGPRKLRPEDWKKLTPYLVRKPKIIGLLEFLRADNKLYNSIPPPDEAVLAMYPDHGLLPGLENRIIYDHETMPEQMFEEESSSFDEHPANVADSSDIFLEKSGVYDPESNGVPGRHLTASALHNIAVASDPQSFTPIHFEADAISEYNNPDLFPGMFPTLFPLGIGGFEQSSRSTPVSLEMHAKHLLDLSDRSFRYHYFYIFVVLNLIQRRKAHLHTSLSIKSSRFHAIAPALLNVHPDVLNSLANNLRDEFNPALFTPEEKDALQLLKEVNTISSKIPGSQASKIHARHEIRSFFSHLGLPILFFTFNPSATHSPIFQVIFGEHDIDLDSEHPSLPETRSIRARNVAKDPVAAADFFDFMRTCLFEDLFGWDFKLAKCKPKGGIFGKLRAHYGATELTERAQFHGHYLIWLWGAPNPSDVHALMRESEEYRERFFRFFEGIIHHHLPDVDVVIEPSYEPRVEMPPYVPPCDLEEPHIQNAANLMWDMTFDEQHKKIGERHQRHQCRPVCYKGRKNRNECRFGFPHEIVATSSFEAETNSIIFSRREPDVNGHNPHVLVATRHNHDLKCILSGRSAKAAMFYISDYILKMPLRTEEMLSLLSKAVVSITDEDTEDTPTARAKRLLHRCLTHFGRATQIHAQHAARLLLGLQDTTSSHNTVPMPSASLLFFIRHTYPCAITSTDGLIEEDMPVQLSFDKDGQLRESNQVHDYFYRSPGLEDITFYDFIRYFTCESKSKSKTKHTSETRLGVLARYPLCEPHIHSETHEIIRHTFIEQGDIGPELIPRVVGIKIPRQGSDDYKLFCLAHFKPFSIRVPFITVSVNQTYDTFEFSAFAQTVMKNWEEVHECQDEKEAERMWKQAQLMKLSTNSTLSLQFPDMMDDNEDVDFVTTKATGRSVKDLVFEQESLLLKRNLKLSKWLEPPSATVKSSLQSTASDSAELPRITKQLQNIWNSEIKSQTEIIVRNRQSKSNPHTQVMRSATESNNLASSANTSSSNATVFPQNAVNSAQQPTTIGPLSVADVQKQVQTSFQLNAKQSEAFHIITTTMVNRHVFQLSDWIAKDAMRLFLTGPGGTGKTHVVKAVKEVLRHFGMDHTIRFLAPTGGAANLIDGTTIHKGLGIAIKRDAHGFTKLTGSDHESDVSFTMSNATRSHLRAEWKDVLIVMIDEVSLVSLSLLAEIDAALRFAKENPDDFYGGLNMIFSGDQFQYPPTAGRALYIPLSSELRRTGEEGQNRIGRLAWNSNTGVISLQEQKRMENDQEYASAVARLRIRQCTQEDINLFNTRVIKSSTQPEGITMHSQEHYMAAMIVKSNKVRHLVNHWKAKTVAEGVEGLNLTACAAQDRIIYVKDELYPKTPVGSVPTADVQNQLLSLDMSSSQLHNALPGWVNLYIGMPVVLKTRNINTDLGVTNGARGYLRSFDVGIDDNGLSFCQGCIVEFPDSKVHLEGLPPKCFPILPSTWTCTTVINIPGIGSTRVRITRTQLPIQAGFAVTGHSAQGQTLVVVLCNLKEGSWAAYVAASRASSRHGLFLTEPVTLEDINSHAIPWDLWFETKRFEILEHNTRVDWGFIAGELQPVPSSEGIDAQGHDNVRFRFSFPEPLPRRKRQMEDVGAAPATALKRARLH